MGDNVLLEESLKYYHEHSKAFLGEKNVRYDVYSKGMPVMTKSGDGRTNIPETTVQRNRGDAYYAFIFTDTKYSYSNK